MQARPRIAMISEHASPMTLLGGQDAGGQNVYVDEVSRNPAKHGYEVDVFTRCDGADVPHVVDWSQGVRIVNLQAGPLARISKDEMWPYMPQFRDEILRFMLRDATMYDLIHGNFWMSGWVAAEIADYCRIPSVQIFHALGVTKRRNQGEADTSPPGRIAVERQVIERVHRIIAQCPHERDELVNDYDADPDKIVTIPAAVNTSRFHPIDKQQARKRLRLDPQRPTIVYVGRLLPRKGIRTVVQALAAMKRTIDHQDDSGVWQIPLLVVVGGESPDPDPEITPEIGELQRLATELGVREHVHFTGQEQPDNLRYFYSAADVAVTTPWYEPFGLTPLEAMACGRPVVGSAVGGLTFTIVDGQTGYLVPPHDPTALSERLTRVLRDPALATQMGWQARARVEREFTWPIVAQRLDTVYRQLLWRRLELPPARLASTRLLDNAQHADLWESD